MNVGDIMGITAMKEHSHEHSDGDSGHHHHHGSTNPHLWFSPEAVLKAANAITEAYENKAGESSNTAQTAQRHFNDWNGDYADFAALINKARAKGIQRRYVATESIINYLLDYAGSIDKTPETYTNAMNSDSEPSAADLKNAIDTVSGSDVDLLVVNPQEMDASPRSSTRPLSPPIRPSSRRQNSCPRTRRPCSDGSPPSPTRRWPTTP